MAKSKQSLLDVDLAQFQAIAKWMDYIAGPGIMSERQRVRGLALLVRKRLQTLYRRYKSQPSETERATIQAGKERGAVRSSRMPREPINIFNELAKHIVIIPEGPTTFNIKVSGLQSLPDASGPRPGGHTFPGGVPLSLLAHWIENPRPITIRMSLRQLGYLHAVREGRGGLGTRSRSQRGGGHLPDKKTQYVYIIQHPDRPVWRLMVAELIVYILPAWRNEYYQIIKDVGKQFGMV